MDNGTNNGTLHGRLEAKSNNGCPYPGSELVEFAHSDVSDLGKMVVWGSALITFVVALHDGRRVHIKACDQDKEGQKFLRRLGRGVEARNAPRGGWSTVWVSDGPTPR